MIDYEESEKQKKKNYFLLKVNSDDEIQELERAGYNNVQKLTFNDLKLKVVVVNEDKKLFHVLQLRYGVDFKNGNVLNFEEFRVINDVNNTIGD